MYTNVTPILKELHLLSIKYRIEYKIILLTFKAQNGFAPRTWVVYLIVPYEPSLRWQGHNVLGVCLEISTESILCS